MTGSLFFLRVTDSVNDLELYFLFQNAVGGGDSNYFLSLAARYAQELGSPYPEVLQQLEDLRLAEWSDHAPPVPNVQRQQQQHQHPLQHPVPVRQEVVQRDYVNYPKHPANPLTRIVRSAEEPIYVPGQYQVRDFKRKEMQKLTHDRFFFLLFYSPRVV